MTKINTKEIKEGDLDTTPVFYTNVAGGPGLSIVDGGGIANSTVIPIVAKFTGEVLNGETDQKFYHGLNNRYFSFMRVRTKDANGAYKTDEWTYRL